MTIQYKDNPSYIGLGDLASSDEIFLNAYIANRPPLEEYLSLDVLKPVFSGEINMIADQTGNHWRKIFNVYSKFLYELNWKNSSSEYATWQDYRDHALLQSGSNTRLLFSKPRPQKTGSDLNIIIGKTYALSLGYDPDQIEGMVWDGSDFAVYPEQNLIVCPYFDYRQLSNVKINKLVDLCNRLI